jgi:molecular chaperone HscB
MRDPFDILGIEARFELDRKALDERHRALSGALHPDRYTGRPAAERRMALERAIEVNSAWRNLKDPVKRAEALLARGGVKSGEGDEPKASPELLMEMMEMREQLSDAHRARDLEAIGKLGSSMRKRERKVLDELGGGFDSAGDDTGKLAELLPLLGTLRYLRRFFEELDAIEEQLVA